MDLTPFKECKALKTAIFIGNDEAEDSSVDIPSVRPCCWFETSIGATSYDNYKEKLTNVDIEKNCRYCIDMEREGGTWSPRMNYKTHYRNEMIVSISFDNLCNLKCITCSPINSSQLANEMWYPTERKKYISILKKEPIKTSFLKKMLSETRPSSLTVEILGGEPLINPAVYDFLDWLIEQPYASNTVVSITTNGTNYNEKFIKYISHLRTLSMQMSIDGIEDTFEYIRFGAKFNKFKEVADKFYQLNKKLPHKFFMSFNYTLSWMNSLHIADYFNWISENYPDVKYMLVTKLEFPTEYCINVLDIKTREHIVDLVSSKMSSPKNGVAIGFDLYKQYMLNTETVADLNDMLQKGKKTLSDNDAKPNRNSKFEETFKPILEILQ